MAAYFSYKPKNILEDKRQQEIQEMRFDKLAKKYERIQRLHSFKEQQAARTIREERKKYLERQQRLTEARSRAEAKDREERENVLERINFKARNAARNKSGILEKRQDLLAEEQSKTIEVKKNLHSLKRIYDNNKRRLASRIERKARQVKHVKQQRSKIEAIREQVAEKIRQNKVIKIDNPYEVFEQRLLATSNSKRNEHHSNSYSLT
eukprot:TRINITY_DN1535_c0_g4_i1.p1 TRINITY_DN1535_c0_g4~~TRINITY_DN1535_c0_g4_i1.p1  ORF type:complete len:208 (-),score=72.12 TRINITY_DN1535_c0_g4_i1:51-674(-)